MKDELPLYGFGAATWVLAATELKEPQDRRFVAAYSTYGACMYRKPTDTEREFFSCRRSDKSYL
jgi:hypothetical protein